MWRCQINSNLGKISYASGTYTAAEDGIAPASKAVAKLFQYIHSQDQTAGRIYCVSAIVNSTTLFGFITNATGGVYFGMLTFAMDVNIHKMRWSSQTPDDCTNWNVNS